MVTDVRQYPEFLPWCGHTKILEQDTSGMVAEIGMVFSGIRQNFTTRNLHVAPSSVTVELVSGPFSKLQGHWQFLPVGDASQRACKVELTLTYGFSNAALAKLIGPVFDKLASTLVDAFVGRALKVYGS